MSSVVEYIANSNAYLGVPVDVISSANLYDLLILKYVSDKNLKLPSRNSIHHRSKIDTGAEVIPPPNKMIDWVVVLDFSQHYPRIIDDFNLGADTLCSDGKIVAANGARFKDPKEQRSILSSFIRMLLQWRYTVEAEREKYDVSDPEYKQLSDLIMAIKGRINSIYGVMGFKNFRLRHALVGEAVTANGRKGLNIAIETAKKYGYKPIYGDSVVGDTKLYIKEDGMLREVRIEDLFEDVSYTMGNKEYSIPTKDIYSLSMTTDGELQWKRIKYVMRHYIEDDIREIELPDDSTIKLTKEHSVMRYINKNRRRKGQPLYEVVKPDELHRGNMIYAKDIIVNKFIVENDATELLWELLGYGIGDGLVKAKNIRKVDFKGYVYDIEVEDNHNFFANGVLVHNTDSIFVQIPNPPSSMDKDGWYEPVLEKVNELVGAINENIHKWERDSGVENPTMQMSFEALFSKMAFFGIKKKYFGAMVYDGKKGDIHTAPLMDRMKVRGFEVRRSDSAVYTKVIQNQLMEMILEGADSDEVFRYIRKVYMDIVNKKVSYRLLLRGKKLKAVREDSTANHIRAYYHGKKTYGWSYQGYIYLINIKPTRENNFIDTLGLPSMSADIPDDVVIDYKVNAEKVLKSTVDLMLMPMDISWSEVQSGFRNKKLSPSNRMNALLHDDDLL